MGDQPGALTEQRNAGTLSAPLVDGRDALYVARQPILDARGRVFGYELLYRASANEAACSTSSDVASARVITDAVLTVGLATLTNGRQAFINLTRSLLVSPVITLLPAASVVFELHEDIPIDSEVIEACRQLHAAGYQLALDDFVPDSCAEALLPFVKFVKVDLLQTPPAMHATLAERLLQHGVRLVAEKVETAEVFQRTKAAGYELFQGYFFCRPATRMASAVPAQQLAYLRLMTALNTPGVSLTEVEQLVKRDPSLCYRILRCVNSAAFGLRREIHSIAEALVLLGLEPIRKWTSLWCLAGVNSGVTSELVTLSLVRARFCELLGTHAATATAGPELFLVGLCSLLDAMLGRPMKDALDDLPLPQEAKRALSGQANTLRSVLDAVTAYERGDWEAAASAAQRVGVRAPLLAVAYRDALQWAKELSSASDACTERTGPR